MERATYEELGGKPVLRFERRLAHPPEKVFRAISEPAELAHWFPATVRSDLRAGAPIAFDFGDEGIDAPTGEVLELDPPKLLVYTWGDDVLRWEVVPERDGCRLVFTHTLAPDGMSGGRPGTARNAAGWDVCLASLVARLDGVPDPEPAWFPLFEDYVDRFGLGEGTVELRFERDVVQTPSQVRELLPDEPPVSGGTVRWELEPRVPGTLIVVTHRLAAAEAERVPAALAAWKAHLERLVAALAAG